MQWLSNDFYYKTISAAKKKVGRMIETEQQGYWQCDQKELPRGQTVSGFSS